jgi:hypothetical protein
VLARRIGAVGVAAALGVFGVNALSYSWQLARAYAALGPEAVPAGVDILRVSVLPSHASSRC